MKLLVVEDDRRIASFLERGLAAEGHQVTVEHDGRDGLERARSDEFELIILDRMLPYIDGLEIARLLREERRHVLILMLTARDSLQDKIEGLKGGADDYLTKPFAFDELLARIIALRRRGSGHDQPKLLRYLMGNADKVVSRERLLNGVWSYGYDPGTKIVDVYVRYLRAKIDVEGTP